MIILIPRFSKKDFLGNKDIDCVFNTITWERIETHWHEYFEMEYIVSGKGTYIIDNVKYDFKPGYFFFMSPIQTHSFVPNKAKIINISFTENSCSSGFLSQFDFTNEKIAAKFNEEDMKFFETVSKELNNNLNDKNYARHLLECIINKIYKCYSSKHQQSYNQSPVKKAIMYIILNFNKKISLNEVANHVGLNPSYFSVLFKKETKTNFKEYLDSLRFEHAIKLMNMSDMNPKQICAECGFENYENFSRRFKSKYNISPSEYIKRFYNK